MSGNKANKGEVVLFTLSTALFLVILFVYPLYFVSASFSGDGSGTVQDPYKITDCNQLQEMRDDLSASYILMNDIDCSDTINWNDGAGFEPIGVNYATTFFWGNFEGDNNKITDLYIRSSESDVGLFGYCKLAHISNVGLENVIIYGDTNVGGLVGIAYGDGNVISNSYVTGSITCSNSLCGGLVGAAGNTLISNSYTKGSVVGRSTKGCVGGLVGIGGNIVNSYSASYVSGIVSSVGGLVGCEGTCTGSFWNVQTSDTSYSSCGIGKTTEEMAQQATYTDAGWDFVDIWGISEGASFPYFLWQGSFALDSDWDGFPDSSDCAPFDPKIHPGARELCNGIDENCDTEIDEELHKSADNVKGLCLDNQQTCFNGVWEDDSSNYMPAEEICNGLDENCNGEADEGTELTFYEDFDADSFGDPDSSVQACSVPQNYVSNLEDCNDVNPEVYPGALEICNGLDDNCNGVVDEGFADVNNNGRADCTESDSDGDSVPDAQDVCPVENAAGLDANIDGCKDRLSNFSSLVKGLPGGVISGNVQKLFLLEIDLAARFSGRNRDKVAIVMLKTLINQIKSQRGKKISASTADMLTAYSNNVITMIKSGQF